MIALRGVTWAHSRGYVPLVAASEAWHDLRPDVEIQWTKRSLAGFGEGPLDDVARSFDLIVFDHPFTGRAAARALFLPLDEHLPAEYLAILESESVGPSYASYAYGGHQWGLPLDTASQIAVCRPDLLAEVPVTWDEVIALARSTNGVRAALSPMGSMGMFHTLCASRGIPLYGSHLVDPDQGERVLRQIRSLIDATGESALASSPVRILGEMAMGNSVLYSPLVYGYSNYCRPSFAPHRLRFVRIPSGDGVSGAVLGGAGLAVSAFSTHPGEALDFAQWVCGPESQSTLYVQHGGQPGLRGGWQGDFFDDALPLVERAFVRPTWDGYTDFQSGAALILHEYLRGQATPRSALEKMDRLYETCRQGNYADLRLFRSRGN